jgi:anti-anti-sigma factor
MSVPSAASGSVPIRPRDAFGGAPAPLRLAPVDLPRPVPGSGGGPAEGVGAMDLVTVRTGRTLPVASLAGELDIAGVEAVSARLVDALIRHGALVADLSRLRFMDCAGIGMLVGVQLQARRRCLRFVLARPTPPVRRLLAAADGVDLLEVHTGLDRALCAAGVDRSGRGYNGREQRGRGWTSELRPNSWRWPARSSGSPTRSSGRSTS